jgi:HlyD family secretion protein
MARCGLVITGFFRCLLAAALLFPAGCSESPADFFQGYAEGEYLYVAAPLTGQLEKLAVARGTSVAAGDQLFTLERDFEAAALAETGHALQQAESRLADLAKGERPSELATLEARLDQARASRDLSRRELERRERLFRDRVIPGEQLDQARTTAESDAAAVAELTAQLQTARLGGRSDALAAARAEVEAVRERLSQARWRYEQKSQAAPCAALVYDTLFVAGELVPAASPVVSLLPPENIKIRFFVPEPRVGALAIGQAVSVGFDGATRSYQARISYISPQAEYTPPVIYSRESRTKLVFMVEARPDAGDRGYLHPGQPVEVRLEPQHE